METLKKICLIGSTGSIGTQTIDAVQELENIEIVGLTASTNIDLLEKQARELNPKIIGVMDVDSAFQLKKRIGSFCKVVAGMEGIIEVATYPEADLIVTSLVGMVGVKPTIEAIKAEKDIALANKETLVTAGSIVMRLAKEKQVKIYPVDSELSAIFQCLNGNQLQEVDKIHLTASGGPFRGKTLNEMETVTIEDALMHPNWSMGKKITIDSATMMNKGLEVIETSWLFHFPVEKIQILVHPQSIIHSMVEYQDGSIMAQLGAPDMRIPIQYALTYPKHKPTNFPKLNLVEVGKLTFEEVDLNHFPCLRLAIEASNMGGTMPTVLNAGNEIAVEKFLNGQISFLDIPKYIESLMGKHNIIKSPTVQDIFDTENWVHEHFEK